MMKLARRGDHLQVERMGRPDIIHNTLLQILETPLNWEQHLHILVHTQDEQVIMINPRIRLPKNYIRFVGLMEQLLVQNRVPANGETLMRLEKRDLKQVVRGLKSDRVLGLSVLGKPTLMRDVADQASKAENPVVLIGGFPRGHFAEETRRLLDEVYCVDQKSLDAWIVAGRFVYDFEWAIGVAQGRIKPKNEGRQENE
jgi:rRNA small subunit pseudouridine methyltransferase Nep1